MPNPVGRPRKISQPITVDNGTRTLTRGDYFIEQLTRGHSQNVAAASAGLSPETILQYVRRGEHRDPQRPGDPEFETFARRTREAKAAGQAVHERAIVLSSIPRPVTTVKTGWREVVVNRVTDPDQDGNRHQYQEVVRVQINETTTREEFDWRGAAWALTHQYGVQAPLDEALTVSADRASEAARLASELRAYLAGREDAAIEAPTVIEVEAIDP